MKKMFVVMLTSLLFAASAFISAAEQTSPVSQAADPVAPFPAAEAGFTRHVIHLPHVADESQHRIEVIVGKTMLADCNTRSILGQIKTETLKGWGYTYYVVETNNRAVSTMMACPPHSEVERVVKIHHDLGLLNYNSRLPVVIYAPSDLTVNYRLWTVSSELLSPEKSH